MTGLVASKKAQMKAAGEGMLAEIHFDNELP